MLEVTVGYDGVHNKPVNQVFRYLGVVFMFSTYFIRMHI